MLSNDIYNISQLIQELNIQHLPFSMKANFRITTLLRKSIKPPIVMRACSAGSISKKLKSIAKGLNGDGERERAMTSARISHNFISY